MEKYRKFQEERRSCFHEGTLEDRIEYRIGQRPRHGEICERPFYCCEDLITAVRSSINKYKSFEKWEGIGTVTGIVRTDGGMGIRSQDIKGESIRPETPDIYKEQEAAPVLDQVELSGRLDDENRALLVQKALGELQEQYPFLSLWIDEESQEGQLSALAAGLGTGTHLVVSKDFLERMASSTEEFAKCSSILSGVAKKLAGGQENLRAYGAYIGRNRGNFWTVESQTKELTDSLPKQSVFSASSMKEEEEREPFSRKAMVSASFHVSRHYSRLAGARSKGEVQSVLSEVQRSIGDLQKTAVYGDDEERVKAGRALRSLRKLLSRGSRKISRLNQQELAALRKKRAEKRQEKRKAEAARLEWKKRRTSAVGADYSLVREGQSDEAYIRGYRYDRKKWYEDGIGWTGWDTLPAALNEVPNMEAEMGGEAGFTASEVTVTGELSF